MTQFVLVHGAFCSGRMWHAVAERLHTAGHGVQAVAQLPSGGTDPSTLGDLAGDAAHLRHILADYDDPVVLVGHSYGGMVLTELADHPTVRHSVYVAAFFPREGESLRSLFGPTPAAWRERYGEYALRTTRDFDLLREAWCADLPLERARDLCSHAVLQSTASMTAPSSAPRRGHPTTYVIAEQESDLCIRVPLQEAMSLNADRVVRLPAAHFLPVSRPNELAELLDGI